MVRAASVGVRSFSLVNQGLEGHAGYAGLEAGSRAEQRVPSRSRVDRTLKRHGAHSVCNPGDGGGRRWADAGPGGDYR
jgi:hypothetical protein